MDYIRLPSLDLTSPTKLGCHSWRRFEIKLCKPVNEMKRKQTQITYFQCFRKLIPEATAASCDTAAGGETSTTENEPDEADVIETLPSKYMWHMIINVIINSSRCI